MVDSLAPFGTAYSVKHRKGARHLIEVNVLVIALWATVAFLDVAGRHEQTNLEIEDVVESDALRKGRGRREAESTIRYVAVPETRGQGSGSSSQSYEPSRIVVPLGQVA